MTEANALTDVTKHEESTPQQRNHTKNLCIYTLILLGLFVFWTQNTKNGFNPTLHGFLSSHGLTIAKNLSLKDKFLMFNIKTISENNEISYDVYNRFPIAAFLIIKAPILLAHGDTKKEVYFSRQLMNAFFIATMIVFFLTLTRINDKPLLSLAATVFTFSGYYLIIHRDMIFNDIPALFGFILLFHGITIYLLEKKKSQLIIKAIIGIFLGWQALGLLLVFILYGFFKNIKFKKNTQISDLKFYIGLAFISGMTALFILGAQIIIDKAATGLKWSELPTVMSAKTNLGMTINFKDDKDFDTFYSKLPAYTEPVKYNISRLIKASIPYLIARDMKQGVAVMKQILQHKIILILIAGIFLLYIFLLVKTPNKTPLILLYLGGQGWIFMIYHFTATHEFQSMFLLGAPLLLYYPVLWHIEKKSPIILNALAFSAIMLFSVSIYLANEYRNGQSEFAAQIREDAKTIQNELPTRSIIYLHGGYRTYHLPGHATGFYFSGHLLTGENRPDAYIISPDKKFNTCSLTPENRYIFLFCNTPTKKES